MLLTVTVANLDQFIQKNKPFIYTRAFIAFYNWTNSKQVYEIHEIIKLKKICILIAENLYNFGAY